MFASFFFFCKSRGQQSDDPKALFHGPSSLLVSGAVASDEANRPNSLSGNASAAWLLSSNPAVNFNGTPFF